MNAQKKGEADPLTGTDLNILNNAATKLVKFRTQEATINYFFSLQPATMLMAAKITGIERASVCRYVSTFRKQNKIQLVNFGICPISKAMAGFYSTV